MSVLVYLENTGAQLKKSAFEAVSYAKAVADQINTNLIALSIGNADPSGLATLGNYGATKVLAVSNDQLNQFSNSAYASVIEQVAKQESADIVILVNTFNAKNLAPELALKLDAALINAVSSLPSIKGDLFSIKRAVFSGKAFAEVQVSSAKKVITLNPNTFEISSGDSSTVIEAFNAQVSDADLKYNVKETIKASNKVPLPEAEIVVSGGRGLKGPENWHLIEDLAVALGGVLACSKPVSDAGWRPHEEHVGQTGITISPNLYVAVGISGAIQHIAGVSSSKTIVAINKDADAPIFKVADYGIVGDALEVVPKLIEVIKQYKAKG